VATTHHQSTTLDQETHSGSAGSHPTLNMQHLGREPRLMSSSSPYRRQQKSTPPLRSVDTRRQDANRRTIADELHRSQGGGAQERREDQGDDRRRWSPQRSRSPHFGCQQRFRSVNQGFQDQLRRRQDASRRTIADESHRSQGGGAHERREDPGDDRRRWSPQRSRSPHFGCQQRFRSVNQGFQDQLREFFADMFVSRRQR